MISVLIFKFLLPILPNLIFKKKISFAMDQHFLDLAYEEARKALMAGEVPVGCVVVKNNKIITSSHNLTNLNKSSLEHAEVIALRQAECSNSKIYVTCEPCIMCMGILARLENIEVFYGCKNDFFGGQTICSLGVKSTNLNDDKCFKILQDFYMSENMFAPEDKRKRKRIQK